jgi:hypothetical protein
MGVWMTMIRPGHVAEATVIGIVLMFGALWGGQWVSQHPTWAAAFRWPGTQLSWAVMIYGFAASVLPVWLLLTPRDYLSAFMKVGTVIVLAAAILLLLPPLKMPAITQFVDGTGPVFAGKWFPFAFITIACGAVSGFHALVASGTTPKMLRVESDAMLVGYGAMLTESFVGLMAMIAAATLDPGVYFAMNVGPGVLGTTADSAAGQQVHTHNLATALDERGDYVWEPGEQPAPAGRTEAEGFLGYRRDDGRVGTRNEIWVIPTVGCVGRTAEKIAAKAAAKHAGRVDGIHAFAHPFGCSQLGDDLDGTRSLLAAFASHPNAGGVLILGLGCESNQTKNVLPDVAPSANIRTLGAQMAGDEIEEGLALIDALVEIAARAERTEVPLSELVLGFGLQLANGDVMPAWNPDAEFRRPAR